MSITTETTQTTGTTGRGPETTDPSTRRTRHRGLINVTLALVIVIVAGYLVLGRLTTSASGGSEVPRSAAMEKLAGVRFSRVVVVGDGGLVTVFYMVLDPEKATQFQADRDHPPKVSSEDRAGGTQRASIMRAGHQMRAGQTYYLVYENTGGAIRSHEQVSLRYGGVTLAHVPVL